MGGDESDGVAPGQWGRDRSWLQRVAAGGSGSTAGVIWTQGWLRPRRQGAFLPIQRPQLQFLREQRFKVVKWRGGREKRESLGKGGGIEWSFVFWLEVDARGTVMVVLCVWVCVCERMCACQALCSPLRTTLLGHVTNTISQMGKLRLRDHSTGEGAEDWHPGPSDSSTGAAQMTIPVGTGMPWSRLREEHGGTVKDGEAQDRQGAGGTGCLCSLFFPAAQCSICTLLPFPASVPGMRSFAGS